MDNQYAFPFNKKKVTDTINNYIKNSIKFQKTYIFEENKDLNGNIFLRDYSYFLADTEFFNKPIICEYAIWASDYMIGHMRQSNYYFIDGTWYKPGGIEQILIIMFKDIITGDKIPGIYTVTNNKTEYLYTRMLYSIKNILTQNDEYELKLNCVITDTEDALINSINTVFNNIQRIGCYYHYMQDIKRNIKNFKNNKNLIQDANEIVSINTGENTEVSELKNEIKLEKDFIYELSLIPLIYGGEELKFEELINQIIIKYPSFILFINNYFLKYKKKYFLDNSYNYNLLSEDCRSNSSLECYNKYIKNNLGKKHGLSWLNFITFIRNEANRIEKINNDNINANIKFKAKYSKFNTNKYTEKKFNNVNNVNNITIDTNFFNPFTKSYKNSHQTNIQWIIWHSYSCRYDSFITLYTFTLYDYLKKNNNFMTSDLIYINNFIEKNHFKFSFNLIDELWKYMIYNNIDINETLKKDGIIQIIDDGFHKSGFVSQLFSIFKRNILFCIQYEEEEKCTNCFFSKNNYIYNDPLLKINENFLDFIKIESVILNNIY